MGDLQCTWPRKMEDEHHFSVVQSMRHIKVGCHCRLSPMCPVSNFHPLSLTHSFTYLCLHQLR